MSLQSAHNPSRSYPTTDVWYSDPKSLRIVEVHTQYAEYLSCGLLFFLILTCSDMLSKVQMQAKCEVFSRFGSSVDFSSGEPLSGVGAPTVGADLCVRLSSPERSLFCGRTRRSAPTQTTSTRKVQPSDSVTPVFVGKHGSCVRCIKARRVADLRDLGLEVRL